MQQRFLLQILLLAQHVSGHHYAHHQELMSIIRWLLPVVFRAVGFQVAGLVWSWGLCVRFAGCCKQRFLLHLADILFPHINGDARSKSHQRLALFVHSYSVMFPNSTLQRFRHRRIKN